MLFNVPPSTKLVNTLPSDSFLRTIRGRRWGDGLGEAFAGDSAMDDTIGWPIVWRYQYRTAEM
jgi:hypothetical protein